jgi:hypothetical protein
MEARVGIEPTHKGFADLSLTTWVPRLGWGLPASALQNCGRSVPQTGLILERETGVEPATSSLARKHSTTELLPLFSGSSIAAKFGVVNASWRVSALSSSFSVHGRRRICISFGDGANLARLQVGMNR